MAQLIQLSPTSWKQPFIDRAKELHLWSSHREVADNCKLVDGTKRWLEISFDPELNQGNIVEEFQITSGKEISFNKQLQDLLRPIIEKNRHSYFIVTVSDADGAKSPSINHSTDRETSIIARVGQNKFRQKIINYWGACSVSKLKFEKLLKASHIKPWKYSNDTERLDEFNGLLLSPNLDELFDKGYISFENSGRILISKEIEDQAKYFGISADTKLTQIDARHAPYLEHHRREIFKA